MARRRLTGNLFCQEPLPDFGRCISSRHCVGKGTTEHGALWGFFTPLQCTDHYAVSLVPRTSYADERPKPRLCGVVKFDSLTY